MAKALVLAGGGARGSYQVGVWRALAELGWRPGIITGTSVGCLNGAMFALDMYEVARDMWLSISSDDVMVLPPQASAGERGAFLQAVVRGGGLDVAPLERIVEQVADEQALRAAPVRLGLVTVEMRTLRPRELAIDEIPAGRLKDYLLASAACFPAFRPRDIDGEAFIDGGYSDNMPVGLAARMGATELVTVDVDGVGVTRPDFTGLPVIRIHSHWGLGDILRFEPAVARRNMALGYLDAYRAFGRLRGTAYGVRRQPGKAAERYFVQPYARVMRAVLRRRPALALTEKLALTVFGAGSDLPLAPLELAAKQAGVDPTQAYTARQLGEAFLRRYDAEMAARLWPLFGDMPGLEVKEAVLAAMQPAEFVAAAVYRALTGPEPPTWAGPGILGE